jgi:quercetin dioxygenase-like cupin family protein
MTPHVVDPRELDVIDVLGPTIQYVTAPAGEDGDPCVMRGTIPPGTDVGFHAHADPETFSVLFGDFEAYDGTDWIRLRAGDIFHVPGNEKHGFRNRSGEPAVMLIMSTVRMGRFFQEVAGAPPEAFVAVAERYGHAVGLE